MCVSNAGQWVAGAAGTGMGLVAVAGLYFLMGWLRRHASPLLTGAGWLAVAQVISVQGWVLVECRRTPDLFLLLFGCATFLLALVASVAFAQRKQSETPYLHAFLALMVHAVGAFWLGAWFVGNEANFRNLLGTEWEPYRPISTAFCYTLIVTIPLLEVLRPFLGRMVKSCRA